jgi:hypothetical protein
MVPPFASEIVNNTLVVVWHGDPELGALLRHYREIETLCAQASDGAFLLNVIRPSAGIPGPKAREALREAVLWLSERGSLASIRETAAIMQRLQSNLEVQRAVD